MAVATGVRWADNMALLASKAPCAVVECGSGNALAPLLAECTAPGGARAGKASAPRQAA